MDAVIGIVAHIAAGLVLIAGVGKVLRPTVTRDALALTRLPAASWLVRALGIGELTLAVAVLAFGGRAAFLVLAVSYAGFVVVAERQRRAGRSCGCFGAAASTAVGPLHLGVNVLAATAAGTAAWLAVPGLGGLLPSELTAAGLTLGLGALSVVLTRLVLTSLPELLTARTAATSGVRP